MGRLGLSQETRWSWAMKHLTQHEQVLNNLCPLPLNFRRATLRHSNASSHPGLTGFGATQSRHDSGWRKSTATGGPSSSVDMSFRSVQYMGPSDDNSYHCV